MKTTSFTIMRSVRRFRPGLAGLALSALAAFGSAQSAHAGPSHNQPSACPTSPSHPSPPPAQPAQVTVVNPVTVTGTVDIGNKIQILGPVETLNDALKIPFHHTVGIFQGSTDAAIGSFYTVPVGMRLTIESVSARILVPSGQTAVASLLIQGADPSSLTRNYLVVQPQGTFGTNNVFVSSQNLKIIVDSSSPNITYSFNKSSVAGGIDYSLTVNGYLEEVP